MGSARLFGASIEGMQNLSMNIANAHSIDIVIKSMEPYEKVLANNCLPVDIAGFFVIQPL